MAPLSKEQLTLSAAPLSCQKSGRVMLTSDFFDRHAIGNAGIQPTIQYYNLDLALQ